MEISVETSKRCQRVDITRHVLDMVKGSKVKDGMCLVYTKHTTTGIGINENEDPEIWNDILDYFNQKVKKGVWRHDRLDGNADAHIKSAMIGSSETIPISDGELVLGTYQSINFVELDGPRTRTFVVKIIGESF